MLHLLNVHIVTQFKNKYSYYKRTWPWLQLRVYFARETNVPPIDSNIITLIAALSTLRQSFKLNGSSFSLSARARANICARSFVIWCGWPMMTHFTTSSLPPFHSEGDLCQNRTCITRISFVYNYVAYFDTFSLCDTFLFDFKFWHSHVTFVWRSIHHSAFPRSMDQYFSNQYTVYIWSKPHQHFVCVPAVLCINSISTGSSTITSSTTFVTTQIHNNKQWLLYSLH